VRNLGVPSNGRALAREYMPRRDAFCHKKHGRFAEIQSRTAPIRGACGILARMRAVLRGAGGPEIPEIPAPGLESAGEVGRAFVPRVAR